MSESERVPLLKDDSARDDPVYVNVPPTGHTESSIDGASEVRENTIYQPYVEKRRELSHHRKSYSEGVDPISLSWENVNVYVKSERKKCCGGSSKAVKQKQILRNVTGLVKPGTLLAIIGASGAGKSTLMNVLTGRNVVQYIIEGGIKVNGVDVGKGIKNISAYVQQDELFLGTLTVREQLIFRALLRMDKSLKKKARLQRVEEVITEMGLSKCADTQVGTPGRTKGISGGEKKRLSFASEALTNPPLMFCDEPTSGLDSFMAQNIVQTLQNMASKGRTILCTIHQPSSEVFAMFDEVLLLAEGRTAFVGPSKEAFEFFSSKGFLCPPNFNPADFYVLTLAIVPGKEAECRDKVEKLCDAFSGSETYGKMKTDINDVSSKIQDQSSSVVFEDAFASGNDRYQTSWIRQFSTVLWRSWISVFRDVILFRVRVLQTLLIALVFGLIYLKQEYNQEGVMNINGALFLLITNASFSSMFSVINSFPIELEIFMREYGSGLYRVDVYFLSKTFAELPTFVFLPWLMVLVLYWMIGFYNEAITFLICSGVVILVANVAVSFGYLISTVAGSVNIALAIAPPLLIPFMLFGGLFLNNGSVPVYFIWLKYISWFQYANEVLSVNQWENVHSLECGPSNGTLPGNGTDSPQRCYRDGQDVLNYLNFTEDNVVLDLCLMCALLVGFRLLAFLVLLFKARRSKS
ncbi:protein white-like [Haliotis rubra]|uniref:protein white-like n=1 Tax=Haliotis rubra TaxID=36100 RepID=UPI001EE59202|nr:protein white-like [Haliotis rubra]XP_046580539.1 protein white-like [Haliotis rubra]